jgi:acyl carrier protein
MDYIKFKIQEVIRQEHSIYYDCIKDDVKLNEDLGFDSLSLVGLIVVLENTFNIIIDEYDLDPANIVTFGDLCSIVEKYVKDEISEDIANVK